MKKFYICVKMSIEARVAPVDDTRRLSYMESSNQDTLPQIKTAKGIKRLTEQPEPKAAFPIQPGSQ